MKKTVKPPPSLSPATPPGGIRKQRLPLSIPVLPYLKDHRHAGRILLPAVEILQHLAASLPSRRPDTSVWCMRSASFDRFVEIDAQATVINAWHELEHEPSGRTVSRFLTTGVIPGTTIKRTKVHAAVSFVKPQTPAPALPLDLASALDGFAFAIPAQVLYRDLVPFGPAFQNVADSVFLNENGALCRVMAANHPASVEPLGSPFILDGALHVACAWGQRYHDRVTFPVGFDERTVFLPTVPGGLYHGVVLPRSAQGHALRFDIWIFNDRGDLCEAALGVSMSDASGGRLKPPRWVLAKEESPLARIREHSRAVTVIDLNTSAPYAARSLSQGEYQRFEKMGKARQKSYLAGRIALKHLARKMTSGDWVTPADAIHTMAPDGSRPCCGVSGESPQVFCSLSHDRRYAFAVAHDEPVGVDVEQISEKVLKAHRLYMGKDELALTKTSPLGVMEASLRVWSIKEGVAKMMDLCLVDAWAAVRVRSIGSSESLLIVHGISCRAYHDTVDNHLFTLVKKEGRAK